MIFYALLGTLALVLVAMLLQSFARADASAIARRIKSSVPWLVLVLVIGFVVLLTITGRLVPALMAAVAMVPWLMRGGRLANLWRMMRKPAKSRSSTVNTQFLRMSLDHDSGALSGQVVAGAFAGMALDQLDINQLHDLWLEAQGVDSASTNVLEAWLDREYPDWRKFWEERNSNAYADEASSGAGSGQSGGGGTRQQTGGDKPGNAGQGMSRGEAYDILGLAVGATSDEIRDAHRRLMKKVHPDQGGSTYLASKINQAKDLLLRP